MWFGSDDGISQHVSIKPESGVFDSQGCTIQVEKGQADSANLAIKILSFAETVPAISLAINIAVPTEHTGPSAFRFVAAQEGPYLLDYTLTLQNADGHTSMSGSKPLWFANDVADVKFDIAEALKTAMQRAEAIEREPLRKDGYAGSNEFVIIAFVEGWVVGLPLHFIRGGRIEATPIRIGYENREAAINRWFAARNGPPIEPTSSPNSELPLLSTITFHKVLAETAQSAAEFIFERASVVATAMAIESGGPCEIISLAVVNNQGTEFFHIHRNSVTGQWSQSSMQSNLGNWLELATQASGINPWIRLALTLFLDANREKIPHHRIFKTWTILESFAKRRISAGNGGYLMDGSDELRFNGKKVKNSSDIARVYKYVKEELWNFSFMIQASDVWKVSKACYVFRNMIAHEGDDGTLLSYRKDDESREASKYFSDAWSIISLDHWAKTALQFEMIAAIKDGNGSSFQS